VSCLLTVTLHLVDVRLTCLINITYLILLSSLLAQQPIASTRPSPAPSLSTLNLLQLELNTVTFTFMSFNQEIESNYTSVRDC